MNYTASRPRSTVDTSSFEIPSTCRAAASFSPFGKIVPCALMSRDEETTAGKTKAASRTREGNSSSIFPLAKREQETRRKERRRTAQHGRKRSVIPGILCHFLPRRPKMCISESAKTAVFFSGVVDSFATPMSTWHSRIGQADLTHAVAVYIRFEIKREEE